MGVVYKARQLGLKRDVALKMILAGAHAGEHDLVRFRTEAEAVARLQHPNIVQVHEVGEADGLPYFALELVDGGSLAAKLAGGPMSPGEAARLVEALAGAMHLAHSRNIVHRDLKPANILIAADGQPKITDFGIARQLDSADGQTQAGAILGTPSYMAPEQASGRAHAAGPPADVYALGAILYECLTGRPPLKGNTALHTLELVRTQPPVPPSQIQKKVPRDLETICLKCLLKEPERRYASARELAEDLERFCSGQPIQARAVGSAERLIKWARRRPAAAGLLAAMLLGVIAVATAAWFALHAADERARRQTAELNSEKVAREAANEKARRLSAEVESEKIIREKDAEAIAKMIVVPLGDSSIHSTPAERRALWNLARLHNDRARQLIFERGLADPDDAIRLYRRRDWAVQAGVALSVDRRDRLLGFLRSQLRDGGNVKVRAACASIAVALRQPDRELALLASQALLDAMDLTAEQGLFAFDTGDPISAAPRSFGTPVETMTLALFAGDLVAIAEWLPAEERPRYFSDAARRVAARVSEKEGTVVTSARVKALGKLLERLSPGEAADLSARALKPILLLMRTDPTPFHLPPALAQLAPYLGRADAAGLLGPVLARMEGGGAPAPAPATPELASTLGSLARRVPQEQIVAAVPRAVNKLPFSPMLQELAGGLPPDEAALAARTVVNKITGDRYGAVSWQLAATLAKLADRLPPEEAADLCLEAVDSTLKFLAQAPDPRHVPNLVTGLKSLLGKVPPERAARVWTEASIRAVQLMPVKPQPSGPFGNTSSFMDALGELAQHLPPDEARSLCATAARKALGVIKSPTEPSFREQLTTGLGELAAGLPPGEAAQAFNVMFDRLEFDTSGSPAVHRLAEAVVKVAERLSPEEASRAARRVATRLKRGNEGGVEIRFAPMLAVLASRLPPDEAADLCPRIAFFLLEAAGTVPGQLALADGGMSLRLLAEQCRDQELITLLAHPFAVGANRTALLAAVNARLHQDFHSQWELVDWLREHRSDLALSSPPRYP
jgi:hypothetical protein